MYIFSIEALEPRQVQSLAGSGRDHCFACELLAVIDHLSSLGSLLARPHVLPVTARPLNLIFLLLMLLLLVVVVVLVLVCLCC